MVAVTEVEPGAVHPGVDQRSNAFERVRCWPQCADDFGPSHHTLSCTQAGGAVERATNKKDQRNQSAGCVDLAIQNVYNAGQFVPYFSSFLLASLLLVLAPSLGRADAQVSVRSQLELGQRKISDKGAFILGGGLRADAMFGAANARSPRIGPALELRTMQLETLEAALGAGVLIPLPHDLPIGLTGLVGPAVRKGKQPDGLMGIGTITWGLRRYRPQSWYGYTINLFFSGRKQLGNSDLVELTAGLELDFVFTTVIPGAAMAAYMKGHDPLPSDSDRPSTND